MKIQCFVVSKRIARHMRRFAIQRAGLICRLGSIVLCVRNATMTKGQGMNHIRIVDSLGGRRINDRIGESHTLCGSEVTDRDLPWRDAKWLRGGELEEWLACPLCRAAISRWHP